MLLLRYLSNCSNCYRFALFPESGDQPEPMRIPVQPPGAFFCKRESKIDVVSYIVERGVTTYKAFIIKFVQYSHGSGVLPWRRKAPFLCRAPIRQLYRIRDPFTDKEEQLGFFRFANRHLSGGHAQQWYIDRGRSAKGTACPTQVSLKGRSCWDVNIRVDDRERSSLDAIDRFVATREEIRFEAEDRRQLPARPLLRLRRLPLQQLRRSRRRD
jgi:hypothetical protein